VLAAMALLTMAACTASISAGKAVDTASIETQIANDVQASRGVAVKVSCPGKVKVEKGGRFTCHATDGKGNSLPVRATQKDDKGHITWNLQALNIPLVMRELTKSVGQKVGTPVEVACPAILVDTHLGKQIECAVTDQHGGARNVVATVEDDQGNISWELK